MSVKSRFHISNRAFNNVLVEPKYFEIHGMSNPLLTVRVGDKDHYQEGLITPDGK